MQEEGLTPQTVALRNAIEGTASLALHMIAEVQARDPELAAKMLQAVQAGEGRSEGECVAVTLVFEPTRTLIELSVRDQDGGARIVGSLPIKYRKPN